MAKKKTSKPAAKKTTQSGLDDTAVEELKVNVKNELLEEIEGEISDIKTKPLDITDSKDLKEKVSDVQVIGDPDCWLLVAKASSASQNWMKSTKAMDIGKGVVVQVTTQIGDEIAEALTFVPNATIVQVRRGTELVNRVQTRS